jgi:hypothetical protein
MAEDTNLKIIKQVTRDWVSGRYDDILPFVADDAVYVIARGSLEKLSPLFGTFEGKAAIKRWYDSNRQVTMKGGIRPFCSPENLGKFIRAGNQVISCGSMPGTRAGPASDWIAIWTLKRSKVVHCWLVMDTATAFVKMRRANPKLVLK